MRMCQACSAMLKVRQQVCQYPLLVSLSHPEAVLRHPLSHLSCHRGLMCQFRLCLHNQMRLPRRSWLQALRNSPHLLSFPCIQGYLHHHRDLRPWFRGCPLSPEVHSRALRLMSCLPQPCRLSLRYSRSHHRVQVLLLLQMVRKLSASRRLLSLYMMWYLCSQNGFWPFLIFLQDPQVRFLFHRGNM